MSLLKLLQWVCWHSLKFFTIPPAAGRNCSSLFIIWIPLPSVVSDTSLDNCGFYFSLFREEKKKKRYWPPYHWLDNLVQSHSHLCRVWLVSSAGGKPSWWWTSLEKWHDWLNVCDLVLFFESHAKLDYWLLSRERVCWHKCLLKYFLYMIVEVVWRCVCFA